MVKWKIRWENLCPEQNFQIFHLIFISQGRSVHNNTMGHVSTRVCMFKVKVTGQDQIEYFFREHNLHILQPIIKSLGTIQKLYTTIVAILTL